MRFYLVILLCIVTKTNVFAQCPDGYVVGGAERAVNGNFDNGNNDFTSQYTNVDNGVGTSELNPEGLYSIWTNPNDLHTNFAACTDITGTGKFMIINGAPTANVNVWRQTITVEPNTLYYFVTEIASVHPTSPARLQFSVNDVLLGAIFTAPDSTCQWDLFYATWNSGANTSATISIVNQNTTASGNDFALDKISFIPCELTLPIELISFKASSSNDNLIHIDWETATEQNNEYFTIERSNDGIQFDSIITIPSQNPQSKKTLSYSYTEIKPTYPILYYRLKQTDFNGKFTYSEIISVKNTQDNQIISISRINSNNKTILPIPKTIKNIDSITIYNQNLQLIYFSNSLLNEIIVKNAPSGIYFLKISSNSIEKYEKSFYLR